MTAAAMVAEFDDVAGRTTEAVEELGAGAAGPAAWATERFPTQETTVAAAR